MTLPLEFSWIRPWFSEPVAGYFSNRKPYIMLDGEYLSLKRHHKYYGQLQLSMIILDNTACDLVVYEKFQNKLHVIQVRRGDHFCQQLDHRQDDSRDKSTGSATPRFSATTCSTCHL